MSLQHMSFGVQLYGNPLDFDVPDSIMTTYKDLLKKPNFGKRRKINWLKHYWTRFMCAIRDGDWGGACMWHREDLSLS